MTVVEGTPRRGHPAVAVVVGDRVSTTQDPIHVHSTRPVHCLRHHASMAACDDCRDARTARVVAERQAAQHRAAFPVAR